MNDVLRFCFSLIHFRNTDRQQARRFVFAIVSKLGFSHFRLADLIVHDTRKFLGFQPWSEFAFFRSFITLPFLAHDPKAIEVVQVILESILLRREKNMLDSNGKKIVDLPPKEVVLNLIQYPNLANVPTRSQWRSLTSLPWKEKYTIPFIFRRSATSSS